MSSKLRRKRSCKTNKADYEYMLHPYPGFERVFRKMTEDRMLQEISLDSFKVLDFECMKPENLLKYIRDTIQCETAGPF